MLRLSARSADSGVAVAVAVLIVMLSAAGTQALGMEAVLGAFFAGILIGSSRWVDREHLTPLRTFVLAVLAPLATSLMAPPTLRYAVRRGVK